MQTVQRENVFIFAYYYYPAPQGRLLHVEDKPG